MIINKHLLKVSMCDIPEGLKAWGADSRDSTPVGGGAGKQMVGGGFRGVWAEQRWRRGQHLPSLPKQNKRSGQEQPRGWRLTERGGSFLKPSPARRPHPLAPPAAHRRV